MRQENGKISSKRSLYNHVFDIKKLLLLLLFQNILSALEWCTEKIDGSSGTKKAENATL